MKFKAQKSGIPILFFSAHKAVFFPIFAVCGETEHKMANHQNQNQRQQQAQNRRQQQAQQKQQQQAQNCQQQNHPDDDRDDCGCGCGH